MRLLDTKTGQCVEEHPKHLRAGYAILSHTWDPQGEQSYQDLKNIQRQYMSVDQPAQGETPSFKYEPDLPVEQGWEISLPGTPLLIPPFPGPSTHVMTMPVAPVSTLNEPPPPHIIHDVPDGYVLVEQDVSSGNRVAMVSNQSLPWAPPTRSWRHILNAPSHLARFVGRLRENRHRTMATASFSRPPSVIGPTSAEVDAHRPECLSPTPRNPEGADPPPTYCPVPVPETPSRPTVLCSNIWDDPNLSPKIRDACAVARADGYRYIWIDSCCIDKTSSSELSEAINSMYQWYAHAGVCYAFLADVPAKADHDRAGSRFRRSRWFARGWTLQELIAPLHVVFLSKDWVDLGSKHTRAGLVREITGIAYNALLHVEPLDKFSVAQRLSWACGRQTTRVEDQAYSLLGIFDINMPSLYGEGHRAFRRLQEEIMRRIPDQSLFAWREAYLPPACDGVAQPSRPEPTLFECVPGSRSEGTSLLAASLSNFREGQHVETIPHDDVFRRLQHPDLPASDYDFTPHGIRTRAPVIPLSDYLPAGTAIECPDNIFLPQWYLIILGCEHQATPGHLLGRVCYIPPSQSGVECLYAGRMLVSPSPRGSNTVFSLFPLSPETIARCRPSIEIKTVYISHPDRADGALEVARWKSHTEINLVLPREARNALRVHGYTASLRGPDRVSHPTTHRLTLVHSAHTITVDFEHRLTYDGRGLDVSADLTVSGSQPDCDSAPVLDQVHQNLRSAACWFFCRPWDPNDSNSTRRVELRTMGGSGLAIYLKLSFATQNHYLVEASVQALKTSSMIATEACGLSLTAH